MIIGETVAVAFSSIRANKMRAMLTMLGIIIGVGAVIAMVALGTGAQKAVEDRINSLGANLFSIFPGQQNFGGVATANRVSLTVKDAEALKRDATLLSEIVPELAQNLQVKFGAQNINTSVNGTTPNYAKVRTYSLTSGRMFSDGDNAARQRYAVLGSDVPKLLNTNGAGMIGQTLLVAGIPFEVIGVLSSKGSQGFQNPDEQILIPLETARYRIFGTDRVRSISIQVKTGVPIEQGMVDMERIMRREHKLRPGVPDDFQVRNPQDILATQQQASEILGWLLKDRKSVV